MRPSKGWIGFDFDGTMAHYTGWVASDHAGPPVKPIIDLMKQFLDMGRELRVFTARIYPLNRCIYPDDKRHDGGTYLETSREDDAWQAVHTIRRFCLANLGHVLPITNVKDFGMIMLYDDRCIQVVPNTGELIEKTHA